MATVLERTRPLVLERTRSLQSVELGPGPSPIQPFGLQVDLENLSPIELLGSGAFGEVHSYQIDNQLYAVKSSNPAYVDESGLDPELITEISVLKTCSHPNVIAVLGAGFFSDGATYAILPFEYGNLKAFLKGTDRDLAYPRPSISIRRTVYQIMAGVAYLHSQSIIHGDLKTVNILIAFDGQMVVADLGLAQVMTCVPDSPLIRQLGTLRYQSPAMILGQIRYSFEVDYWSLGCIIYEIMTGKTLFFDPDYQRLAQLSYDGIEDDIRSSQLKVIFSRFGSPDPELGYNLLPFWTDLAADLPVYPVPLDPLADLDPIIEKSPKLAPLKNIIYQLLNYDPDEVQSAAEIIKFNPYFADLIEADPYEPTYHRAICREVVVDRAFPFVVVDPKYEQIIIELKAYIYELCDITQQRDVVYFYAADLLHTVVSLNADRFGVNESYQIMVAIACLWVGSLYRDKYNSVRLDILARVTESEASEIRAIAQDIIQLLSFDLLRSTSYDYYRLLQRGSGLNLDDGILLLVLISLSPEYPRITAWDAGQLAINLQRILRRKANPSVSIVQYPGPDFGGANQAIYDRFVFDLEQSVEANRLFGIVDQREIVGHSTGWRKLREELR